jgi:hypothetical protein
MDDVDWEGIFFGLGVLILGTVLVVVTLIQIGAFSRARIARRDDQELKAVVERYEQLAGTSTRHQETVATELGAVRARLDEIEALMRQVD